MLCEAMPLLHSLVHGGELLVNASSDDRLEALKALESVGVRDVHQARPQLPLGVRLNMAYCSQKVSSLWLIL